VKFKLMPYPSYGLYSNNKRYIKNMDIKAVIHFENANWVYLYPKMVMKVFGFYTQSLKSFGINKLCVINVDAVDFLFNDAEIQCETYNTLDECIGAHTGWNIVALQMSDNATNLKDFIHPVDKVLYVIGPDFTDWLVPNNATVINIPNVNPLPLWSHSVLSIVLYDRYLKCL
jgi:hypothetical protein